MGFNKKFFTTGGIVASAPPAPAAFDPLQNFETVAYTGNGGTQKITGYIRKGAAFNGSSSKIVLPNSSFQTSAFTVSAWCNVSTSGSENSIFEFTDTNTGDNNTLILLSAGSTSHSSRFLIRNRTTNEYQYRPSGTPATGWNHYCLTFDGSTVKSYINGSEVDSASFSMTNTVASTNEVLLGLSAGDRFLNGKLDQVRIFDRALDETTDGEVTTLYNEDYDSSTKSTTDIFRDGSGVALYELDEDANSSNFEQSAVFNGSSSQIAASESIISTPSSPYSLSLWFKKDSTNYKGIFMNKSTTERIGEIGGMFINATTIGIYTINTSNSNQSDVVYATVPTMSAGVWYHLVIIADNSLANNGKVYINGTEASSYSFISSTANMAGATGNTLIGTGDGAFFDGDIDQVRIYDAELSTSDITKLYNESSQIPTTNLVAHYKLDGNAEDATETYDGTASNVTYSAGVYGGTPTNVNFLGMAFKPDLVWVKAREASASHALFDSVRGVNNILSSESISGESDLSPYGLTSFDTNGFTVSDVSSGANAVNGSAGGTYSGSGAGYVAWCWKAAGAANTYNVLEGGTVTSDSTASGAGITAGTITTGWEVSANRDAGFSIVKYQANATQGATIGHGLSSAPEMIITKEFTGPRVWCVYHKDLTNSGYYLELNTSNGESNSLNTAYAGVPTSSTYSVGNSAVTNNPSTDSYIAYCFHSVDEYQKVGSYSGNSTSGRLIDTGFQPRFVLIKTINATSNWFILDSVRGGTQDLRPNGSNAEETRTNGVTFVSNGFEIDDTSLGFNSTDTNYIYLAIA